MIVTPRNDKWFAKMYANGTKPQKIEGVAIMLKDTKGAKYANYSSIGAGPNVHVAKVRFVQSRMAERVNHVNHYLNSK